MVAVVAAVRLSIGLEDFDDLRADFEAGITKVLEVSLHSDLVAQPSLADSNAHLFSTALPVSSPL